MRGFIIFTIIVAALTYSAANAFDSAVEDMQSASAERIESING